MPHFLLSQRLNVCLVDRDAAQLKRVFFLNCVHGRCN